MEYRPSGNVCVGFKPTFTFKLIKLSTHKECTQYRSFRPRYKKPVECANLLIAFSSTDNYRDFPHCKGGVVVSTRFLSCSIHSNSISYKPRLKTVSYSIVPIVLTRSVLIPHTNNLTVSITLLPSHRRSHRV